MIFSAAFFLLLALAAEAGSPQEEDLRTLLVRLYGDPLSRQGRRVVGHLRGVLAATLGERVLKDKWRDLLPDPGLHTKFAPLLPWLLPLLDTPDRPEASHPGVDIALDLNRVWDWWNANQRPALDGRTWRSVATKADHWHQEHLGTLGYRTPVPDGVPFIAWEDGAHLDRVETPAGFDLEGIGMGHCLRRTLHYWNDFERGDILIVSYRDHHGVPQATIEVNITDPRQPVIIQLQGPHNGEISDRLVQSRLAWWLVEELGLVADPTQPGQGNAYKTRPTGTNQIDTFWAARIGLTPPRQVQQRASRVQEDASMAVRDAAYGLDQMLHRGITETSALAHAWRSTMWFLMGLHQEHQGISPPTTRLTPWDRYGPENGKFITNLESPRGQVVFALKADLPRHMVVWTVHRGETLLAEDTNPYDALLRAGLFTAVGPKAETTVDLPAVLHRGRQGVLRLMTREQALAPYRAD